MDIAHYSTRVCDLLLIRPEMSGYVLSQARAFGTLPIGLFRRGALSTERRHGRPARVPSAHFPGGMR